MAEKQTNKYVKQLDKCSINFRNNKIRTFLDIFKNNKFDFQNCLNVQEL
jgi:hypothetical protein